MFLLVFLQFFFILCDTGFALLHMYACVVYVSTNAVCNSIKNFIYCVYILNFSALLNDFM